MSNNKKNKNEIEKVAQEVERATASIFDDGEYDEEGNSVIGLEGDGDIFWLIQSFFWSVIKTVSVLGIVFLLLWIIWGGDSSKKIDLKDFSETKTTLKHIEDQSKKLHIKLNLEEKTGFMTMIDSIKHFFSSDKDLEKNPQVDLESGRGNIIKKLMLL